MTKPDQPTFNHPEWDRIWAALNKLVEDIPTPEVEWDSLMSQGYDLFMQMHILADEIEGSLEMIGRERDHHMDMFGAILDDDGEEDQEDS